MVFRGFRAFISISPSTVYGPFSPSQAGPSHSHIPSCHAEVNAIKHAISMHKNIEHKKRGIMKKVTLYVTRWSQHCVTKKWLLRDCVPCINCLKYIEKIGIKSIYISDEKQQTLIKKSIDELYLLSKYSSGVLYGNPR